MGDVLSQKEIDNLLAALSTGELDVERMQEDGEKQVKNYDFSRPTKFSKEHLRTLEIIFEHYGRLISTNLPVYLFRYRWQAQRRSPLVNLPMHFPIPLFWELLIFHR